MANWDTAKHIIRVKHLDGTVTDRPKQGSQHYAEELVVLGKSGRVRLVKQSYDVDVVKNLITHNFLEVRG